MDANKLAMLRESGYRIAKSCGLCKHGVFVGTGDWGSCAVKTYEHLKHTGPKRQLSIYRGGACTDKFEPSDQLDTVLGAYREFLR
jgi:hypothetical protein